MKKKLKSRNPKIIVLSVLSGILMALAFPPIDMSMLYFPGVAVLIFMIFKSENYKQLFVRSYTAFLVFELIAGSWIALSGIKEDADKFLILAGILVMIIQPLFFLVPVFVFYFFRKNVLKNKYDILKLFAFPFIWTACEFIFSFGDLSFPWYHAGNAFSHQLYKIQFIEITGIYGLSLWVMLICTLLFIFYLSFTEQNRKKSAVSGIVLIVLFILPGIYTHLSEKTRFSEYYGFEKINIGVIQPNIDPWLKWGGIKDTLINDYVKDIIKIHHADPKPDLVVFPETAVPFYLLFSYNEKDFNTFRNISDSLNLPIFMGVPDYEIFTDSTKAPPDAKNVQNSKVKYSTYNSAILIDSNVSQNNIQKYHKIKLVTGSEKAPFQEYFSFFGEIIKWGVGISSYQSGKDLTVFKLPVKNNPYDTVRFSAGICYESVYPGFFSGFFSKGAEFGIVITNDGWWGKKFGTYQHNRYAVFRAIENRRWIVRCANTGISSVIDPFGNMLYETEINQKAVFTKEIGRIKEKTFHMKNPDLFPKIFTIITALLVLSGFFSLLYIKLVKKKN